MKKQQFKKLLSRRVAMTMALLLMTGVFAMAQTTITGVVQGTLNEPLIGASVVLKGNPSRGTVTNFDGEYSLKVDDQNETLIYTYLGYKKIEMKVGNKTTINVVLEEDLATFEEVVVVGYGTQKKVNLTGAVAAVSTKDLEGRASSDILSTVQGQIPGVTIISRPGAEASINFRGRGNLGTSSPLYVVDGAVSDGTVFNAIDPSNIESISFLKDAASSAIYGARAAYGVVLVTTKGGDLKEEKLKVDYSGYVSVRKEIYRPKVLNSFWYATLENEATFNENPNATLPHTQEVLDKYLTGSDPDYYPNTNWYDLVLNDYAPITRHSLTISGGNKIKHSTSVSYMYNENFAEKKTDRYNVFSNVSSDVNNWLTFRTGIKLIKSDTSRDKGDVSYVQLLTTPSTYVARQSNGEYGTIENGGNATTVNMQRNPLRLFQDGGWEKNNWNRVVTDLAVDIKPIDNLVVTASLNYYNTDSKVNKYTANLPNLKHFNTGEDISNTNQNSEMEYEWKENKQLITNLLARYSLGVGKHGFDVLGGTAYEQYNTQTSKSIRKNFPTNGMTDINGGSGTAGNMSNSGGSGEYRLMSYFGRLNYNFDNRYLFEANIRADGSSRFADGHRWGVFPSFSAGWRVNQEAFMQEVEWVHNLKLRASWGKLGNINNVGDYDYYQTYKLHKDNNYNFNDEVVTGISEAKPANLSLSWETVTITDIGLDLDLFGGKFGLVFDYYYKKTKDILLEYNVANEIGIHKDDKPSGNVGIVVNKGFELGLRHNNNIGDFKYGINVNFTKNTNKIKDLGASGTIHEEPWIKAVKHSIGTYYVYKTDGLLTQEDIDKKNYITDGIIPQAGDIKYVDIDGDGKLTGKDRVINYCDVPDFTYGIGLNAAYKSFDFSVFGQGITGTHVRFYQEQAWAFSDFASPREYHLSRWTVDNPNPNAAYPRIYPRTSTHSGYNQKLSDFWLFDSDYFRVKNITLGYTLPTSATQKLSLSRLRMYFAVDNPFTIRADKRMKDFDPESASGRGQLVSGERAFTFGVDLSF